MMPERVEKPALFHDITNNKRKFKKKKNGLTKNQNNKKKNVTYLSKAAVNQMAQDIRMKKELAREIGKLKSEISKTDSEIVRYQTRYVPDIKYEISKRQMMCKKLQNQYASYDKDIESMEGQKETVEMQKKEVEEKLANKYLSLGHIQEDEFEENMIEVKNKYESELNELEVMQPKDELEVEINNLREKMLEYLEQCDDLKISNKKQVKEEEIKIKDEFEQFKHSKQDEINQILDKGKEILETKSNRISGRNELNNQLIEMDQKLEGLRSNLSLLQSELDGIDSEYTSIESKAREIDTLINSKTKELEQIQEKARFHDERYNDFYNTMEIELAKRKKLENSIDEVKGLIRCFLYADESKLPGFTIDYLDNVVLDEEISPDDGGNDDDDDDRSCNEDEIYPFSRIIPSGALSVPQLIFREYKPYHDMCINGLQNFTLFSVSSQPWIEFKSQFIEFLLHEYSSKYEIKFQNVFLSDGKNSKDLLATNEDNNNNEQMDSIRPCINLKFDNDNNLILNSHQMTLIEYFSNRNNRNHVIRYDSPKGINLFKFKFIKKKKSLLSNEPDIINFYLIQFEDIKLFQDLSKFMSLNKCNEQSHIGYVINRLMINLKSCFLFDLSSDLGTNTGNNTIEELLRIGVKIGQIPNTQGMKKSTLKREKN